MSWEYPVAMAVAAIESVVGPRGQWPGWVVLENAVEESSRDMAPPLTALGMLCLDGVPGAQSVLNRSRQHLELTVLPGGVWRYYANIPWDSDDTAMCALALGAHDPIVADTRVSLAAARTASGRFLTWPTWPPDQQGVDAVANAHVVAVLGATPDTADAVGWLTGLVEQEAEVDNCCYYPDPLDLHMAVARAVAAGVEGLRPALVLAGRRAVGRLADTTSAYRLAQMVVVALASGIPPSHLGEAGQRLADMQDRDGFWAAETLFYAVSTREFGGRALYTSQAVTTALCARALAQLS